MTAARASPAALPKVLLQGRDGALYANRSPIENNDKCVYLARLSDGVPKPSLPTCPRKTARDQSPIPQTFALRSRVLVQCTRLSRTVLHQMEPLPLLKAGSNPYILGTAANGACS